MIPRGQDLIDRAAAFAAEAHGAQVRKYTGDPYVVHTSEVADIVAQAGGTPEMIAAGHLHDVLEDTPATEADLEAAFGPDVTRMVVALSDQIPLSAGNRATRKRLESLRLAACDAEVQTVKLADIISNTRDIRRNAPGFARAAYLPEMRFLVPLLAKGHPELLRQALEQIGGGRTLDAGQ